MLANVKSCAGVAALLIDTAPRPQPAARELSAALGALYLPMPRVDAHVLSGTLQAALDGSLRHVNGVLVLGEFGIERSNLLKL